MKSGRQVFEVTIIDVIQSICNRVDLYMGRPAKENGKWFCSKG